MLLPWRSYLDYKQKVNKMRTVISIPLIFMVFLGGLTLFTSSCQPSSDSSFTKRAARGKELYDSYCKACHGKTGDGPLAHELKTLPPDLTKISARRNSTSFPILEVVKYIDGRKDVSTHGTREMPVWGDVLKDKENLDDEKAIEGKIGDLLAYLESIQK